MNNVEVRALQSNTFQLLSGIPITPTQQLYFNSTAERDAYFDSHVIWTFTDMKFVREHRALKVALNVETLEAANYMRFRNNAYNGIWMYCSIDRVEYMNPNASLIYFTIDAWQTYFMNVEIRDCDIAREHVPVGSAYNYSTVAEGVDYGDYVINSEQVYTLDSKDEVTTYVIISTINLVNSGGTVDNPVIYGAWGNEIQGLPTACEIDYLDATTANISTFFQTIADYPWIAQGIISIFPFPADFIPKAGTTMTATGLVIGRVHGNISGGGKRIIEQAWKSMFPAFSQGKLYCYPYSFIEIVVDDGTSLIIKPELLEGDNLQLVCNGCCIPIGQVLVAVANYAGNDAGATGTDSLFGSVLFSGFPSFPVQNDQYTVAKQQAISTYELIHQQNWKNMEIGAITSAFSTIAGGAIAGDDGGLAGIAGALAGGINWSGNQVMSIVNEQQAAARDRQKIDQMQGSVTLSGQQSNGAQALLMTMSQGLSVRIRAWCLKPEFQQKLEQYFDAFGYKSNRIGVPNMNNRPRYNYVRCNSANIYGNIPQEHLSTIRNMFLNGVTFWHDHDNVGTYGNNG